MRLVIATNVLISALLISTSLPAHLIVLWREGRFDLLTSALIRHQNPSNPPLALINQADSLGLRHTDHHQRGARCWHRACWVSSMKKRGQAPA